MNKRRPSISVVIRYAFFQTPGLLLLVLFLMLLQYWLDIPVWFVFCVIALWILKEVALVPLVWQAYDADERRVAISMIGARGVAKQPLAPSGYVRVRGELWRAEVLGRGTPVEAGEVIRVREIHGLTLRVEPEQDR